MDKLKMQTVNKADENFKKLADMFPNAVTEAKDENGEVVRAIDKDVLMQEINTKVVDGNEERYQFTWPDKKKSVLRFLALGVFTPLMRNHAALGTRNQECYSFENSDDFKDIVEVRYRLIPYLYRTFKKASKENDMIFRPLSFDYPDDKIARECETQLMLGDECMICPVYEQNVGGRYVYLPENMTFVKLSGTSITTEKMSKGTHYIEVALNEVPLFIKDGRQIELCKPAMRTSQLDTTDTVMIP